MDERALVLGGGGSAGNAWLIGVVAGLLEGGVDVTEADLVIGTSAGATAAVQVTGASATGLLADILGAETPPRVARGSPDGAPARAVPPSTTWNGRAGSSLPRRIRPTCAAGSARRRSSWRPRRTARGRRGGAPSWRPAAEPTVAGALDVITAVDARTGEPVVFDRHSGVDLVDAVAASTSSGAAYAHRRRPLHRRWLPPQRERRPGSRVRRVLVLSPLGGRTRHPLEWGTNLAAQVDELRAGGSRVETILPDSASLDAFGSDLMDPSTRPPAARAGHEQGRAVAEAAHQAFWR